MSVVYVVIFRKHINDHHCSAECVEHFALDRFHLRAQVYTLFKLLFN